MHTVPCLPPRDGCHDREHERPAPPASPRCPVDMWLEAQLPAGPAPLDEKLRTAQAAALRDTLAHARRSVFYGAQWRGLPLQSVRGVDDLPQLPFTTAEDLARWGDFLCVSQGEVERLVTLHTSGTQGVPKRLAFTAHDLRRTRAFFSAGMAQLLHPGQTLLVLLPGAERPNGVVAQLWQALRHVRVASCRMEELPAVLEELRPHTIVGGPSQLRALLPLAGTAGTARLPGGGLLSSAEPLDADLCRQLERRLDCTVLDHYGLTESGYGGGVQCLARNGFHMRALDVLVEIVHPLTGLPLPPGEEGEIVITTLHREAMPLVRYRTGDVAAWLPGPCACGSPLPRLGEVRGRLARHGESYDIVRPAKGRAILQVENR